MLDNQYLYKFKEVYHLFPYFHEINNNVILKSEYIREFNYFVGFINKYFGEEILKIPQQATPAQRGSKIPLKNSISSVVFKKIDFYSSDIKDIRERVYENFRFLNMSEMPIKYFRYNIPNYTPTNNITKISKKLNSMVIEIEKRIEKQKLNFDMQNRKKVALIL